MIPYRTRYSNLSVVTRVCPTSSKDPDGSGVVREVWSTGSSLTENDSRVGGPQFHNRKGQVSIRARLYSDQVRLRHHHGPPGRFGPAPHSRFQNGAGGLTLINKHNGTFRQRCNPYGRPSRRREGWIHRRGGGGAPRLGGGAGRRGEGNEGKKWFKIIIPYGNKYNKKWLLTALQNLCPVPFIPQFYSTEGHKVHFYLEDAVAASALCSLTRRITDNEGYKVVVFMNQCSTPPFVQNELKPQDLEHLKQCMSKRFDTSQKSLDLSSIRTDPDLVSQNIDMILSRKYCIEAVIKIIEENIPELQCLNLSNNWLFKLDDVAELVTKAPGLTRLNLSHNGLKSERELDKLKGFRLAELWLDRNPLCNHFKDQTTYISAVRERFPRLLKLDGHDLSPPIGFDVETHSAIPQCKGSYFVSEDIRSLIHRFLQHYYSVYDSGDRQPLLDAYHDGSCFSLSVSFTNNPSRCSLGEYHKDSRNVKKLKDPSTRFRLLKHTRVTVVAFLNELPKTQHDITSFIVDVNTYTSTLLAFTVSGVFKETDGKSRDSVRAFSRVFVAVPAGNSGLCIVNDELFVRNATTEEIRRAFVAPAPTPSSSPVPTLSASQQEMLYAFSQKSEMNLEWSQKCLQDNEWNFNRAAQIFTELKAQGKIPQAAFIK